MLEKHLEKQRKDALELAIIKLYKISNKLELEKENYRDEIKYLKEIEKDINDNFNIKLSEKEKKIIEKYIK